MRLTIPAAPLLCLALLPLASPAPAKEIDRQAIFRHIHETFNTPLEMKFSLKELKPSTIPGFLVGKLELSNGVVPLQVQTIHVSEDGRYYFLSPAFKFSTSAVAGLRPLEADPTQPTAPPVYLTQDGRYMLYGTPMDLSVDPDADNLRKMTRKGVFSWGPESAPVVLAEYSDMECPHCKRAHETLEKELPAAFKDKVRWVFKNYPLVNTHPWSYSAALAATCAAKLKPQTARQMVSSFFHEQDSISIANVREKGLEFAGKAGIDSSRFGKCLDDKSTKASLDADIAEGNALDVAGTPAIFVNGRRARNYDIRELKAVVEEKLSPPKGL